MRENRTERSKPDPERPTMRENGRWPCELIGLMMKHRKDHDVARTEIKTLNTKAKVETNHLADSPETEPAEVRLGQRKRPESRFCLQVDRQTKASYATYEAAEQAALVIKKGHPIVRVAIYDTVESVNKVIDLP
jgi:hypothetical protein